MGKLENSQEISTDQPEKKITMSPLGDKSLEEQDAEALIHIAGKLVAALNESTSELDDTKKSGVGPELIKEKRDRKEEAWTKLNAFMFENAQDLKIFQHNKYDEKDIYQRGFDPLPKPGDVDIDSIGVSTISVGYNMQADLTTGFEVRWSKKDSLSPMYTMIDINNKTGEMTQRTNFVNTEASID